MVLGSTTMLEAFYLDPDELPVIDTETTYAGLNLEFQPVDGLDVGLSYVTVPESDFNYFGPRAQGAHSLPRGFIAAECAPGEVLFLVRSQEWRDANLVKI